MRVALISISNLAHLRKGIKTAIACIGIPELRSSFIDFHLDVSTLSGWLQMNPASSLAGWFFYLFVYLLL